MVIVCKQVILGQKGSGRDVCRQRLARSADSLATMQCSVELRAGMPVPAGAIVCGAKDVPHYNGRAFSPRECSDDRIRNRLAAQAARRTGGRA